MSVSLDLDYINSQMKINLTRFSLTPNSTAITFFLISLLGRNQFNPGRNKACGRVPAQNPKAFWKGVRFLRLQCFWLWCPRHSSKFKFVRLGRSHSSFSAVRRENHRKANGGEHTGASGGSCESK